MILSIVTSEVNISFTVCDIFSECEQHSYQSVVHIPRAFWI